MRQRPKQASYVQKMDMGQMPNRDSRQVTVSAPSHQTQVNRKPVKRDKKTGAVSEGGGKMTKFISLDDIPDGIPNSPQRAPDIRNIDDDMSYEVENPPVDEYVVENRSYSSLHGHDGLQGVDARPQPRRHDQEDRYHYSSDNYSSRVVINSSPICVPNDSDDDVGGSEASGGVAEYSSPTVQRKNDKDRKLRGDAPPVVRKGICEGKEVGSEQEPGYGQRHNTKGGLYYSKNPRKVEYRPYTLEQYKSIKSDSYVEYGKLKPDLNTDELKAKRANADRVKEFSKNLNSFNRQIIKSSAHDSRDANRGDETKSAREKALDFSKNIPKPKVRRSSRPSSTPKDYIENTNGYGTAAEEYCMSQHCDEYGMLDDNGGSSRLQELQRKHGENKKRAEAIKKSLGLVP